MEKEIRALEEKQLEEFRQQLVQADKDSVAAAREIVRNNYKKFPAETAQLLEQRSDIRLKATLDRIARLENMSMTDFEAYAREKRGRQPDYSKI
ncbi:hypothetical protein [Metapseudomonas furukawaii]